MAENDSSSPSSSSWWSSLSLMEKAAILGEKLDKDLREEYREFPPNIEERFDATKHLGLIRGKKPAASPEEQAIDQEPAVGRQDGAEERVLDGEIAAAEGFQETPERIAAAVRRFLSVLRVHRLGRSWRIRKANRPESPAREVEEGSDGVRRFLSVLWAHQLGCSWRIRSETRRGRANRPESPAREVEEGSDGVRWFLSVLWAHRLGCSWRIQSETRRGRANRPESPAREFGSGLSASSRKRMRKKLKIEEARKAAAANGVRRFLSVLRVHRSGRQWRIRRANRPESPTRPVEEGVRRFLSVLRAHRLGPHWRARRSNRQESPTRPVEEYSNCVGLFLSVLRVHRLGLSWRRMSETRRRANLPESPAREDRAREAPGESAKSRKKMKRKMQREEAERRANVVRRFLSVLRAHRLGSHWRIRSESRRANWPESPSREGGPVEEDSNCVGLFLSVLRAHRLGRCWRRMSEFGPVEKNEGASEKARSKSSIVNVRSIYFWIILVTFINQAGLVNGIREIEDHS